MRPLRTAGLVIGAVILAFFAYGFIVASTPDGKARAHERAAIDRCWKEQGTKSFTTGQARSVASVCERLEADFRTKWHRDP